MILSRENISRMEKEELISEHHTALGRGYVSRKTSGYGIDYRGKFGAGIKFSSPNWKSTQYKIVTYFLYTDKKGA